MYRDPRFSGLFDKLQRGDGAPPSLLQKLVAVVVAAAVFSLALMFSVVLFAVVLTVGAAAWGYLWWKTRALRKTMRAQGEARMRAQDQAAGAHGSARGLVIEGEVIREVRTAEGSARPPGPDA